MHARQCDFCFCWFDEDNGIESINSIELYCSQRCKMRAEHEDWEDDNEL